jgi:hypothetical protein
LQVSMRLTRKLRRLLSHTPRPLVSITTRWGGGAWANSFSRAAAEGIPSCKFHRPDKCTARSPEDDLSAATLSTAAAVSRAVLMTALPVFQVVARQPPRGEFSGPFGSDNQEGTLTDLPQPGQHIPYTPASSLNRTILPIYSLGPTARVIENVPQVRLDQPAAEADGGTVVAVVTIGSDGAPGLACGLVKPSWLRSIT